MSADRSWEYEVAEQYEWREGPFQPHRRPPRRAPFRQAPKFAIQSYYRRLLQGMSRLVVAARYALSNLDLAGKRPSFAARLSIPWWKIGLVALAVFIVLKKDIQFSLDLKSPLGAAPKDEERQEPLERTDAFGVAQSVTWGRSAATQGAALDAQLVRNYIDRYGDLAVSEMHKFGIPASIKLGQAILGSGAGARPRVRGTNNHFGPALAGMEYDNAWHNWREHSLLLYHEYPGLFELDKDYRQWARALQRLQYTDQRDYAEQLIGLIERYELDRLDALGAGE